MSPSLIGCIIFTITGVFSCAWWVANLRDLSRANESADELGVSDPHQFWLSGGLVAFLLAAVLGAYDGTLAKEDHLKTYAIAVTISTIFVGLLIRTRKRPIR